MKKPALIKTAPPHLKSGKKIPTAMRDVFIALLPVTVVAIYFFGQNALVNIVAALVAAAVAEIVFRKLLSKSVTLHDFSALLTGLLVALVFPPTTAWWTVAIATILGVGLVKELMGGLGWNRFNPALGGYIIIFFIAQWLPFLNQAQLIPVEGVTQATPLAMLNHGGMEMPALSEVIVGIPVGNMAGAMAEVSPLAVLVGAAYLLIRKHIGWHIPVAIIATVFVLTLIAGENPLYHIFTGGIMLGAFFMATDWVTSPITPKGKLIFGVAIGVLIVLFRLLLPPTEGVAFSILIMNAFVPYIEKVTRRPSFSDPLPESSAQGAAAKS